MKSDNAVYSYLRSKLCFSKPLDTAAIRYSKESEILARARYAELKPDFEVVSSGSWMHPDHLKLAASPDEK